MADAEPTYDDLQNDLSVLNRALQRAVVRRQGALHLLEEQPYVRFAHTRLQVANREIASYQAKINHVEALIRKWMAERTLPRRRIYDWFPEE